MPEPVRKPQKRYPARSATRVWRIPVMYFPDEATPEQEARIASFLSYLKDRPGGLESLELAEIRQFGAPFEEDYDIGNPQDGYLLLKAWIKAAEAKEFWIPETFYRAVQKPNEYLNPTHYIPAEAAIQDSLNI